MAFRVARMARVKSGALKARKAIPEDVKDDYQALYGKRWEELFRTPAGCSPQRAKTLHGAWLEEIESRIAVLRAKQRGEGHDLTQKQALALAGEWYRWFTGPYDDDPGKPDRWADLHEALWELLIHAAGDEETGTVDLEAPEVRTEIHPRLAAEAKTDQFLASKGEVLTPEAMALFLNEVIRQFSEATKLLERKARRDYSPDQHLQTLPLYDRPNALNGPKRSKSGKTCVGLFEAHVKGRQPAASTVDRWRVVFTALDQHLNGRDIDDFSPEQAQRWATSLIGSGSPKRSARTVKDIWISAVRTVLTWALKQKLVASNPFADVLIDVPRKAQTREDGKAFSEAEQQTILKAALAIKDTSTPVKAAYRWVPWLCAYSGARAGEITQLRGQDLEQRGDYWVMKITPDAGTVKGLVARIVPIHEHVIEPGFPDYAKSKGKGPLFYNPLTEKHDNDDPLKPRRPRAVMIRNKLAEWVRGLGIADTEIRPNHGWRHTFKTRATRARIDARIRDAICGHAPRTVGDQYITPTVEDMANALKGFPRYKFV
jgi:integrase